MSTIAELARPVIDAFLGEEPSIAFRFWDDSALGPTDSPSTVLVRSSHAFRRLFWSPNELGLGRAYVAGEIDIEGDIFSALALGDGLANRGGRARIGFGPQRWADLLKAVVRLGALGLPLAPPPEEARLKGPRHSRARDAAAISHHYDVSNDFYRLVLGESMTYSCACFDRVDATLEDAQVHKYEVVCNKLGLEPGMRLLDVGCGWGGMIMHAAKKYGVEAVGITLSRNQADYATKAVSEAGLATRVQVRYQDYRDISDGPFDAISSIGMFEHVGLIRLSQYFEILFGLLRPGGRLLNHGISCRPGRAGIDPESFVGRYVFPDGELVEVGRVATSMQERGFEVRDVESLREHYALTLRRWVANLERNWKDAVELVGQARSRIWRLYMAGSALSFEGGRINVHQVLAVKPGAGGVSKMPLRRAF